MSGYDPFAYFRIEARQRRDVEAIQEQQRQQELRWLEYDFQRALYDRDLRDFAQRHRQIRHVFEIESRRSAYSEHIEVRYRTALSRDTYTHLFDYEPHTMMEREPYF